MKKRLEVVGKPRRRVDGRAKVLGQLRFADDLSLPRMLHCKLLRSPHPHALVEKISCEKARRLPGVHLVLTREDFPVPFGIMPVAVDEYPLTDHARHVGDPIAAVIAVDEQVAFEALGLIEIQYKNLKTISDPEEALNNPEPRIHDYGERGNIHRNQSYEFGDVDEALAKSDHVFEDLFFYQGNTHLPMEQQATLAVVKICFHECHVCFVQKMIAPDHIIKYTRAEQFIIDVCIHPAFRFYRDPHRRVRHRN